MPSLSPRAVKRALTCSVVDGVGHAIMVGVSESYLGALAVELGHSDTALALLFTVPMLCGALAQLASGPLVALLGSARRLVVLAALVQAACHLGFLAIAWTGHRELWSLLGVKVLFWMSGSIIAPAWNAWMSALTEGVQRERYFAWRSGVVYLALMLAYVGGGLALEAGRASAQLLETYGWLYLIALAARLASVAMLRLQAEPAAASAAPGGGYRARLGQALRSSRWRVALFMAALMLGVHISAPFYTPYILRDLGLDYSTYALLTAVSILVKALVFPLFHRVAERVGLRPTLALAGLGVAVVPMLWAVIADVPTLFAVEVLSGVAWAGLEFASFQLILQSAREGSKVEFFSLASAATGLAQLAGALLGSALLAQLSLRYVDVFMISAAARALPLALLVTPALAVAVPRALPRLIMRVVSVRAVAGVERRPILQVPAEVAPARAATPVALTRERGGGYPGQT